MTPIEIISLDFLILSLVTVAVYYILPPRSQTVWLVAVSYFFYGTWNIVYPIGLLLLTIINFVLAKQIQTAKSRWLFYSGIGFNAGTFLLLKALTSPYEAMNGLFPSELTAVLLPIGFSFYILQILSYLTDVYRGQIEAENNFLDFALYVAYFPKMLAGPIERAGNFLPQLKRNRIVDKSAIEEGSYLILLGLLRKLAIADQLARLRPADVFTAPDNYTLIVRLAWLLVFAVTLYNDFAGYTSIVRGVSTLMGIRISSNFRQPFLAHSFSDFWTRWHITLSEWLRDYIFFPVRRLLLTHGANRWLAFIVPPLVTMLASGFWHGAYLAMLLWGGLHGVYLIFEQILQQNKWIPKEGWKARWYQAFVFTAVTLAWIPFNSPSVRSAGRFLINPPTEMLQSFDLYILPDLILLCLLSVWLDLQEQKHGTHAFLAKWKPSGQMWATAVIIIVVFFFASIGRDISGFIYQGF